MRCLQHVLWRGGLALGLLVSGGTGAILVPQPAAPACEAATRHVDWNHATVATTPTPHSRAYPMSTTLARTKPHATC